MNVAYGLGRLGVSTLLVTSLGADDDAALIRHHLDSAGVEVLTPGPQPATTSRAFATLSSDDSADYSFDISWDLAPFEHALPPSDVLHAGSIALVMGRGGESTRAALRTQSSARFVTIDPNIREAVIADGDDARRQLMGLMTSVDLVKLSIDDARWMFGDVDPDEVASRLLDSGARLVAVTLDSEGSLLAASGGRVRIPPRPVAVVDTIGAGDAYMSGLIAGVLRLDRVTSGGAAAAKSAAWTDDELSRLGHYATTVASLTVARAGAAPPTADEVVDAIRDD